jgi:uncharacterized membrane protein
MSVPSKSGPLSNEQLDIVVSRLLRTGVALSAAIVFVGGSMFLVRHGLEMPDYRVFRGEPADLRSVRGIFHDALALRGRAVIQLGLLLLIATPVARVAYLVFAFARQRDRLYSTIALIVLVLLAYGWFGPQP